MALFGVVFASPVFGFLEFLVSDHHQTWPSAVMSRPLTEDKKKYVRRSTDRSRGRSTGVGPLVLKIPPFASGQKGVPRPPVEESGTGPGAKRDPWGQTAGILGWEC